jgi:hypothetical protein
MSEPATPRLRFLVVQFALAAAIVILLDRELRELLAEHWRRWSAEIGPPKTVPEPSPVEYARLHDEARKITMRGE